jgi:hypothetical protein
MLLKLYRKSWVRWTISIFSVVLFGLAAGRLTKTIEKVYQVRNSPGYQQHFIDAAIAAESEPSTFCGTMDHREFTVVKVVTDELLGVNRVIAETEGKVVVSWPVNPNTKFAPGDKVKLVDVCHPTYLGNSLQQGSMFVPASTSISSGK